MLCLLRREQNYSLWARWQYQEGEGQDASFVHVWLMDAVKPNKVSWHRLCQNCVCILAFIKGVSSSNCCVQSSPLQRRDRCKDVRSRTARTFRSAPCCQDTANNCNVGIKMKSFFFFSVEETVALETYRICPENVSAPTSWMLAWCILLATKS